MLSKEREIESTHEHVNGKAGRPADNVRNMYAENRVSSLCCQAQWFCM